MNYSDISAYVADGKTPTQIAAILQTDFRTVSVVSLNDLLFTLNNRGMLVRLIRPADTGEKWAGSVVNMILHVNTNGTAEEATAVNQWFSHITNDRNNTFDTTDATFAGLVGLMQATFGGQPTMPTVADFDAIFDLGGGRRFADTTPESVQALIDVQTKTDIKAATLAVIQDQITPLQNKLNAMSAWLITEAALAMSVAEYQTYADALAATDDGNPVGGAE